MTAVSEMSVPEAASKALEILLLGGYDNVDYINDEFLNSYTTELSNSSSAWENVKYEASTNTVDELTAKVEAQYGGEGMGDAYWVVVSLSDGNTTRYFRKDGWYASYDGGSLDGDTFEVAPREKTIVEYV